MHIFLQSREVEILSDEHRAARPGTGPTIRNFIGHGNLERRPFDQSGCTTENRGSTLIYGTVQIRTFLLEQDKPSFSSWLIDPLIWAEIRVSFLGFPRPPFRLPPRAAGAPPWRPWNFLALAHFSYVKTYSVCAIILICLCLSHKKLILRMASSGIKI